MHELLMEVAIYTNYLEKLGIKKNLTRKARNWEIGEKFQFETR